MGTGTSATSSDPTAAGEGEIGIVQRGASHARSAWGLGRQALQYIGERGVGGSVGGSACLLGYDVE